jgi:predicted enzyme related to lactoylglutathione lyase
MVKSVGALILFTARLEEVVAFYRRLGFPLEEEDHDHVGPIHLACDLGATHFAIFAARADPGAADAARWRSPGSSYFGVEVEGLGALIEEARAAGCSIRQEPETYPWGVRALLDDPDGRVVELFEH